jgi:hypothetical protein
VVGYIDTDIFDDDYDKRWYFSFILRVKSAKQITPVLIPLLRGCRINHAEFRLNL